MSINEQAAAAAKAIVDNAEQTYRSAERSYEQAAERIESMSSRNQYIGSMDLNLKVAADSGEAMRSLAGAHEAAILAIDRGLRPLLEQGIDSREVVRAADLIAEINRETRNIGANVGVSLNGSSLGTAAIVAYQPSVEAQAAEVFWDAQAAALPDLADARRRAEQLRQEREEEKDRIRQRMEAAKERREKEKRDEANEAKRALQKKKPYLDRVKQYRAELEALIPAKMERWQQESASQISQLKSALTQLKVKQAVTFSSEKRAEITAQIGKCSSVLREMERWDAKLNYERRLKKAVDAEATRYRAEVQAFLNERFPYGKQRLAYIKAQKEKFTTPKHYAAKQAMVRSLMENGPMLLEELRDSDPRFAKFNRSEMYEALKEAYASGYGCIELEWVANYSVYDDHTIYRYSYKPNPDAIASKQPEKSGVSTPMDYEDKACTAVCPPKPDAAAFFANVG
ncbi:MAG: hypothetical protein IJC61_01575 [Oscillospiraceae bacterium]|nr:hypothetical protein [Oscillospiraceae bacterium]